MATLAGNATIYGAVGDALGDLGFTVKKWSGWANRTASRTASRIVTPTSVCIHHTAGNGTKTEYIRDGDPGRNLPGPLTNWHITRDGVIHLLGCGYQNHAGLSYQPNYDRIVAGTASLTGDLPPGPDSRSFSANRYMMAVEVNGDGGPDDFTPLQYRAAVALAAECHRVMRWTVPKVGAHKELTRRKPGDPVANMGVFRTDVLAALAKPWGPEPGQVVAYKLGDRLLSKDGNDRGADVAELARLLISKGYEVGAPADEFGPAMAAAVRDFQAKSGLTVDGLVGAATVAALTAAQEPPPDPIPVEPPAPDPTPEPTPVPPPATTLRVATLNCLDPQIRQGDPAKLHPFTAARCDALVRVLLKAKADFYCLTEAPEVIRDAIRARMPGGAPRWKCWERGSQAIMFDSKRWGHNTADVLGWGYHGAIVATFTEKRTSDKVSIGVYHLPPDSLASKVTQQARMETFADKVSQLPGVRIIGGDGMNDVAWAPGWTDARAAATSSRSRDKATYHTGAITDRILSHGPVTWRGYSVLSAGAGSDHDLVVTALTIGAPTDTV